uniref:Uncharacterized protein n=1 Tax=Anguilla anguilla TaxID=7936 RepID=A0A0E9R4C9_ANGAN
MHTATVFLLIIKIEVSNRTQGSQRLQWSMIHSAFFIANPYFPIYINIKKIQSYIYLLISSV